MYAFLEDYKNAFKPSQISGLKRWINFTLKSCVLALVLAVFFGLAQYFIVLYTPLIDYVTVPGIEQSNRYGLTLIAMISFAPSLAHLFKILLRTMRK